MIDCVFKKITHKCAVHQDDLCLISDNVEPNDMAMTVPVDDFRFWKSLTERGDRERGENKYVNKDFSVLLTYFLLLMLNEHEMFI